ncbi:MAG: DUF5372 family protein, partial [Sphingomonadaceae bacterium]
LQLDLQLAKSTEERFQLELRQTVETLQGDRVYFHDDQGQLRTLSAGRTSLGADDPFVAVSANRSAFRAVDLLELAGLLQVIQEASHDA